MRGQGVPLAVAFAALLVGALLLKGVAGEGPGDPTPSVTNGAPAGWLALKLLLERQGVEVRVRADGAAPFLEEGERALVLIPPPAASSWSEREAAEVLALVAAGRLSALLVCDDEPPAARRLRALTGALGAGCVEGERVTPSLARGTLPAYEGTLFVRGRGRVAPAGGAALVPAYVDEEGEALVLRQRQGVGAVTLLGSPSVLANDGLGEEDNARFLLSLVPPGGHVVVEESHHRVRGAQALEEAFAGTGPRVALLALLLLVPAVLFGFAPRRGDPPPAQGAEAVGAAAAQARALAALYRRAGVQVEPAAALDPEAKGRARSAG